MVVIIVFLIHWQLAVFLQSFFLHRYGAHKQFRMSAGWERFFHLMTYLAQGPSFLSSRAYAILHRMHHAYSDGARDPHSPENHPNVWVMMFATKKIYDGFAYREVSPEAKFDGDTPDWPALDRLSQTWLMRVSWSLMFVAFYAKFATHAWMYALVPLHWILGPLHGAIVNWCGHRYGYRNFDSKDVSRNTLPFDILTAGELFQNNHHKFAMSPNFAVRWFEIDTTYQVMRLLAWARIINMQGAQTPHYTRMIAAS
jgi:stearoyl-CoA desaturase (Delta-9 desaturase)